MTQRYLCFNDAAEYLGLSIEALRMRVRRRSIRFVRDGKLLRFDKLYLDDYMRKRTVPTKRELKQQLAKEPTHHDCEAP